MTQDRKILAQNALSSTTLTDCYTVPTGQKACLEQITICNRWGSDTTFRVSIVLFPDTSDQTKQYIYYDATVPANDSLDLYKIMWLKSGDIVRVYAGNGNLSSTLNWFEYHE